jgi:hypothetical protein
MGLREGFGFLTRDRLTVAHLQEADKSWRKYEQGDSWLGSWGSWIDREWAWWNVNLALNVAPNNLKAMRLKDKILSSKKGRPVRPAPWTLWDSVQEHMNPVDRTRGLVPGKQEEKPKAPEAKPEPPRDEAPAEPVAPPAADVAPKAQGEKR